MNIDSAKARLEYPTVLTAVDYKLLFKDLYKQIAELQNELRKLSTDRPKVGRPPRENLPTSGV
jgi:hypothetical protein